jgi:hypothetical protein
MYRVTAAHVKTLSAIAAFVVLLVLVSGYCIRQCMIAAWRSEMSYKMAFCHRAIVSGLDDGYVSPSVFVDKSGNPLYSWRFRLLPLYLHVERWPDWSLPWTAPENKRFRASSVLQYCETPEELGTTVMAVTGDGTAFPVSRRVTVDELSPNLIILIEVNSDIHWMAPHDVDSDTLTKDDLVRFAQTPGDGFHVTFLDGVTWALSRNIPLAVVKKFTRSSTCVGLDRDAELLSYRIL